MSADDFTPVCAVGDIPVERGVAALVGGVAVAIFRTHDGAIWALGNHDPCSNAPVLARGIVGSRGDTPIVSSPMFKQAFDLRTGECLDEEGVSVPVHAVRIDGDQVLVGPPVTAEVPA